MTLKRTLENAISCEPKTDLRQSPRYKINTHLKISRAVNGVTKIIPGYARNISEGGIGAFVPGQLSIGETVAIEFAFPRSKTIIAVRAVVRAIDRFHYNLEFVGLDETARQLIADCGALLAA